MTNQMVDRDPGAWGSCDAGELKGLSQRLQSQQARKTQTRVMSGVLAATMALLAVTYLPGAFQADKPVLISCAECVELMPAYNQHLAGVEEMPADDFKAVKYHLEVCAKCQDHYEQEFSLVALAGEALGWINSVLFGETA